MAKVMELRAEDESAWDEYVQHSQDATPYHLVVGKRVMERTYGHPYGQGGWPHLTCFVFF
jgi:hypothetical protein